MANFFDSLGYGLGKAHTGMLAYVFNLWNEGHREPLQRLARAFDLRVDDDSVLVARREWNGIDLVVFARDRPASQPLLVVETKVDDAEIEVSKRIEGVAHDGYQTEVYPRFFQPGSTSYWFLTLGASEYRADPVCSIFRWIRTKEFSHALAGVADPIIDQWRAAILKEVERQEAALRDDRAFLAREDYRAGTWNLYVLGSLRRVLMPFLTELAGGGRPDASAYCYGTRPDTILNFGWKEDHSYMEINYSGRLSLKLTMENFPTEADAERGASGAANHYGALLSGFSPGLRPLGGYSRSKTLMSFETGLEDRAGYLRHRESEAATSRRVASVLSAFYGGPDCRYTTGV
jgi:hypothetical protein